jgi:transposase-like protein
MVTPAELPREDDLPGDLPGFFARFSTEAACAELLRRWKYPQGFRCPSCGGCKAWFLETRRLDECAGCGQQVSLTAGTLFHKTRKPLSLWFAALFLFVSSKQGISAVELGRQLKLRQATAWTWLHKIRSALGLRACGLLSGAVEVDETYEGGVEKGVPGRGARTKTLVGAAVEVAHDDRGLGRARLRVLRNASSRSLRTFVGATVAPGSLVLTDGWRGYGARSLADMEHDAVVVKGSGLQAHEALPAVHRVFALLHRVLLGTHQGAVRRKHLDAYLREFEFRFNRRSSLSRGLLFQRLLSCAVLGKPPAYWRIVGRKAPRRPLKKAA